MYLSVTIFLMTIFFQTVFCDLYETQYPKCCGKNSVMSPNNSSYDCIKNSQTRLEIATNTLQNEGVCIEEIDQQIALFHLIENKFVKQKMIDVEFIPKCCPSDYYFNITKHSCVKAKEATHYFFKNKFLKIGLKNCEIVTDHLIDHLADIGLFSKYRELKLLDEGSYCIDRNHEDNVRVLRQCSNNLDICKYTRCVLKCCPDGQSFIGGSICKDTYEYGIDLQQVRNIENPENDNFTIIHGYTNRLYKVKANTSYYLDNRGYFHALEKIDAMQWKTYNPREAEYCIEHFFKKELGSGWDFFRPFPTRTISHKYDYTKIALIFSSICLLLTIFYYCGTKQKNSFFRKTLISYCCSCLILSIILTAMSFYPNLKDKNCVIAGFCLLYVTFASFAWMNIMCFDIYWTVGSATLQNKKKELKRFLKYSLYGWGVPLILTVLPLIFYHVDVLPSSIQVRIGKYKCYIENSNYGLLLFSSLPIAIGEICNTVLFLKTIFYCIKVKSEINKMNDSTNLKSEKKRKLNTLRERLGLLIKLFLIMGISFLFEIVGNIYDFRQHTVTYYIELIWDTFNCLQGVFIFMVFVPKAALFKKCEQKLPEKFRRISHSSNQLTQTTNVSNKSEKKLIP